MNLILFGPPGAGKGTQSQFLAEKYNLTHVSTGDLLRAAIKEKSKLGLEAQKFMNQGLYVPDDVVIGLIKESMAKQKKSGMLLDGFPRTPAQAEALDRLLSDVNQKVNKSVFLDVSKDLLKDRLVGRRVCNKCGKAFHVKMNPPKKDGVCDACGGTLEQRPDDQESVIGQRLDVYEKSTAPLKDYYKKSGNYTSVDGVGEPAKVFQRICKVVEP